MHHQHALSTCLPHTPCMLTALLPWQLQVVVSELTFWSKYYQDMPQVLQVGWWTAHQRWPRTESITEVLRRHV